LVWVWARGASKKCGTPLLILATVEASKLKFGTQLAFGEYVTITAFVPNLVAAGWSTGDYTQRPIAKTAPRILKPKKLSKTAHCVVQNGPSYNQNGP